MIRPSLAVRGFLALGIAWCGLSEGTAAAATGEMIDLAGRTMIFDDEFDHLSVSAHGPDTVWSAHTPWNGDFGQAAFVDPQPGFPFTVKDGILRIEMRRGPDGAWRSGLLSSSPGYGHGFTAPYGYFEMRARLPAGEGVWPGFWLDELVPHGSRTHSLEVDIIEHYGKFPAAYNTTVTNWDLADSHGNHSEMHIQSVPSGTLSQAFHTFGAEVSPQWVIFYFDRREIWRTPTPRRPIGGLDVLVDLGLGGGWPIDKAPPSSTMEVDYIRVYQPRAAPQERAKTVQGNTP
ncbi:glycoside hydrolase family 16 protein [Gluconacetobacter sacchari]|uniref:Glycoside hydrolase family 16 protein n=2 Tax=Gluconacetobacter sacchari TaxID=92759 RepID=A0A7W4NRV0_9PROT|nr:glycoside hydrolase family 16 protein [Gluconacetobacter sacchari]MBB2160560.1 glycoside hydrolase family 16 protein [Gluconacetobacter sacchari]GBQ33060.1 beta-glucanase/beta-glucan synthetase [Gluconacetobacter sacchari DSM 12717]